MFYRLGIKVKFRVFGITLGVVSRLFRVSVKDSGFQLVDEGDAFEFPVHAQIAVDTRGVKLGYWIDYA